VIDLEEMAKFTEPEDMESLGKIQQEIQELLQELARRQGIEKDEQGLKLTPKAYRLFQNRILGQIFEKLRDSRTGRHQVGVEGDGAVEMAKTRPFEFGDSPANLDLPGSFVNAIGPHGRKDPGAIGNPRHGGPPHPQAAPLRDRGFVGYERINAL